MLFTILSLLLKMVTFSPNESIQGTNNQISITFKSEIILQENLEMFSYVNDLIFDREVFFAVTENPSMLLKYDLNGLQQKVISRAGRGPFEYLMPTLIDLSVEHVVLWDAMGLKLIFFKKNGTGEFELIDDIRQSIRKFIYEDNQIFLMKGGSAVGGLIEHYEIENNNLSLIGEYGSRNPVHDIISRYAGTHPIAFHDEKLYYGVANNPELFVMDLNSGNEIVVSLESSFFKISDQLPNVRNSSERREFLFSNSRFKSIHATKEYLICEFQHGSIFDGTRKTELLIYDYNLNLIDSIVIDYEFMQRYGNGIIRAYNNRVYFLKNFTGFIDQPDQQQELEKYQRRVTIWEISEN
jgi:hypothetical protein